MKTLIASLAALALVPTAAQAATLDLEITNVEASTGSVMIAVFSSADEWTSNTTIAAARIDAAEGTVRAVFEDLPEGTYGVKIFHDVDGNGDLKRGKFGIPAEPYAFSNDAPVRFGPPSWKSAAFDVSGDATTHTVALR